MAARLAMTPRPPRLFILTDDPGSRGLFKDILYGYDLEFFDSLETARQALAERQYDLVVISNLGFRPGDAVDLIPHDHAYPVLFYSGFMDARLAATCQSRRICWCAVPFFPRTLLTEVVRALGTRAPRHGGDT